VLGQSGTERPEFVLVTKPPAKIKINVLKAVNLENHLNIFLLFELELKEAT
tara:strand:- start:456 stop:608 length:153 start_codon:yes stop_codon:yes gene_type:complete